MEEGCSYPNTLPTHQPSCIHSLLPSLLHTLYPHAFAHLSCLTRQLFVMGIMLSTSSLQVIPVGSLSNLKESPHNEGLLLTTELKRYLLSHELGQLKFQFLVKLSSKRSSKNAGQSESQFQFLQVCHTSPFKDCNIREQ